MALDFEQTKEIEELKQGHKKELLKEQETQAVAEHGRKMRRLEKLLEIAKAGGVKAGEGI